MLPIALAAALVFCSGFSAPSPDVGTLAGRVIDRGRVTRTVRGATVSVQGTPFAAATDSLGRFRFSDIPAGRYILSVQPIGGTVVNRSVTILTGEVTRVAIDIADRSTTLEPVVVTATRPLHVIGHLPAVAGNVIYDGKKTELVTVDSLHANVAQDVERQILGRIPGANFSETAGAGFPSSGVGFRGLDPTQSVEVNTRQNGVNIAADPFGYPETYYSPPTESLERIEVVRGAGSLAFGPQFGGAINYVTKHGSVDTRPLVSARLSTGAFGLFNGFADVSGGSHRATYYGFVDYRRTGGWRPNSDFEQVTAYGGGTLRVSDGLTLGLDYTLFRNRIHLPGGLTDAEFTADPDQSFRARNWLASPWNVFSARADYRLSPTVRWLTTTSYLAGDRHLVWRNEDGGPEALDVIDPTTGELEPREVERETFHNATVESRLRIDGSALGRPTSLAIGVRGGANSMQRFEGGPGSTGSDFDMNLYGGTWERALRFHTTNLALFAEQLFRPTDRLSLTPGVRLEHLRSTAVGYTDVDSSFAPRTTTYLLPGFGAEYVTSGSTSLYANVSAAYRPILYESLTPFGSVVRIDPSLHAARGYNVDLGWRGVVTDLVKFDVSAFYLHYGDRIGVKTVTDGAGGTSLETSNIGDSRHQGVEAYLELDLAGGRRRPSPIGAVDFFGSFAFVDARYMTGPFAGNRVEQAPRTVTRAGLTHTIGRLGSTLQLSHTASSFGDANNLVVATDDAEAGLIPAYTIVDWSGQFSVTDRIQLSFGINNVTDTHYFTKRTGEYPGPGILPGLGRSFYLGFGVRR